MYQILKSGSSGNAVLYYDSILIDCGVPFVLLKEIAAKVKVLLITHEHCDHINLNTIKSLQATNPSLRIGCGEFMLPHLPGIKNVDFMQAGIVYDYGLFKISPFHLYHSVPCFGYRLKKEDHRIIHCTDTGHLEGISAKGYDLYALEHNYDEDIILDVIARKDSAGEFSHERMAINNHLSEQQARDFFFNNKKDSSVLLRLHESKSL